MTDAELDDNKTLTNKVTRDSRIARIARGSGHSIREVHMCTSYVHACARDTYVLGVCALCVCMR